MTSRPPSSSRASRPSRPRSPSQLLFTAGLLLALAGCGPTPAGSASPAATTPGSVSPAPTAVVQWPAPPDPMGLTVEAGLVPETKEYLEFHVHAHLDVFIDGVPVLVPAGIGINVEDPDVRTFNEPGGISYGGIEVCAQPCISPLHAHDESGVIHTESATLKANTLGQFFVEWAVELSETCVGEFCSPGKPIAFYVDGLLFEGDPNTIELTDRKQIAIVIGTPPPVIPAVGDFSNA